MKDSYNIRKIFTNMELDLIKSLNRNLKNHDDSQAKENIKFEQWQSAKLRDLERFRRENQEIVGRYSPAVEELIEFTLVDTYKKAQLASNEFIKEIKINSQKFEVSLPGELEKIKKPIDASNLEDMYRQIMENISNYQNAPTPLEGNFFKMNDKKFNVLIESVQSDMDDALYSVLRRTEDIYRQTIYKSQVYFNTGTYSINQSIDLATKDFLAKGIDSVTYKDGSRVNISSYAEMALRTANHRAYLMSEGKTRENIGNPLVIVSAHATACKLCIPWQAQILIDDVFTNIETDGLLFPKLSEAIEKGLLHPNCRHNLSTYFPGITSIPKLPTNEKEILRNYQSEQKQRYIERQIRKYKRLYNGSIDEKNKNYYREKVLEWQDKMRNHININSQLRRNYYREK
ncbi:MAG TPA: phage minor capsid protein [Tissierellaceae bacterium]